MRRQLIAFGLMLAVILSVQAESGLPKAVAIQEARVDLGDRSVRVSLAIFSARDLRIRVIDNVDHEGQPRFKTLSEAMAASGCLAGCNGGFFDRKPFAPVGGMISDGQMVTPVDHAGWMKGALVVRSGVPNLISIDALEADPEISDLLQSGTWLVRDGQSESDNSRTPSARRTFVCHDGQGTWALGAVSACSLHELANLLRSPEIAALLDVKFALNFDGGPSTGLWIKKDSTDFYLREGWPVRNYIGVTLR